VDTLEINIPFTLFSFVPPWVMTDWTSNLMKIGVAPKAATYPELITYYRPNENSLEQAALSLKQFH
jgi:hypothetical protein